MEISYRKRNRILNTGSEIFVNVPRKDNINMNLMKWTTREGGRLNSCCVMSCHSFGISGIGHSVRSAITIFIGLKKLSKQLKAAPFGAGFEPGSYLIQVKCILLFQAIN
jgi:hypothetical protein